MTLFSSVVLAQEICDNGIDDDGDGLIDLNDPDCNCSPTVIPSLIPNPSFEQHNCCPTGYSQMSCATGWAQATSATSDYFNCSFQFQAAVSAGLTPTDGTGMVGTIISNGWQEYVGSCLSSPLIAGQSYTIQFSVASTPISGAGGTCNGGTPTYGPIDLTLFGNASCVSFPMSGVLGCPPGFTPIGTVTYTPAPVWSTVTMTFTPSFNVNSVILGSPCTLPSGYNGTGTAPNCYAYFYWDNLILNSSSMFNSVTQTGRWCDNNIVLSTSPNPSATFQWYLGGVALAGETGPSLNVSANNYGPGTYTVASFSGGSCATSSDSVVIPDLPAANFGFTNQCNGVPISFTDSSTVASGSITNWQWDFGDGNTSNVQNPSNQYASDGTYIVSLTVTSDQGCSNTITQPVTSYAVPTSAFDYTFSGSGLNAPGGCLYESISFADASSINTPDNIISWNWDFGDGNTSTVQNPTYQYTAEGTYTVKLIITSNNGCTDSVSTNIDIYPVPVASFTTSNVCVYNSASFQDNSTISTGSITNWLWDFGDGNTSSIQSPTNLYNTDGTYTTLLVVISNHGCSDTTLNNIVIYPQPQTNYSVQNVCIYDPAVFTDQTTINAPDSIASWAWNFGDGNTDNIQNPIHFYNAAGSYDALLLTTSNNGCIDSISIPVRVFNKPVASYTVQNVCLNDPAIFTDNSTVVNDVISNWDWGFGDGQTDNQQSPSHFYGNDGTFTSQLIVTTANGCKDTLSSPVTIYPIPNPSFSFANDCYYNPILFSDQSTINAPDNISQWDWNFGDGSSGNTQSPSHQYPLAGTFNVTLTTTSNNGCINSTNQPVTIYPQPNPLFLSNNVCVNTPPMSFTDISTITSGSIVSWNWTFGDGSSSVNQFPNHTYPIPGTYNVQLVVTSNYGCEDSISVPVTVYQKPNADFGANTFQGCTPVCVNFSDLSVANSDSLQSWFWNLGNSEASTNSSALTCYENTSNSQDETYDVTLIVSNSNGCYDTITKYGYITSYHYPVADFSVTPAVTNMYESKIEFTNLSIGADNFYWTFGDSTSSTDYEPQHDYLDTGTYSITLIASTIHNCADTAYNNVLISAVTNIYVPNTFTPNGDGKNDQFFFEGYGIVLDEFEFAIFDRWGELIYLTHAFNPWDGTYHGSTVQNGVYVYRIRCKDVYGEYYEYIGHVNVIR